jgi:type VI secretion system ImpC/EvpB family protein/type VI secretion system ImpB/VipA family protein
MPPAVPKVQFEVSLGSVSRTQRQPRVRDAASPLGVLILGNFRGNAQRAHQVPIAQRTASVVDCDNFDTVMGRLDPGLHLEATTASAGAAGQAVDLHFTALDDFHPDSFLRHLPRLSALAAQRKRLLDPHTADAAAGEVAGLLTAPPSPVLPPSTASPSATLPKEESADEALARLMGGPSPRPAPARPAPKAPGIEDFIKRLAASSTVPAASAQQTATLSLVDLELAAGLRAVLHHPEFQALEAAWRGLARLVQLFGGEENIKLHIADVTQEELAAETEGSVATPDGGLPEFIRRLTDQHDIAFCLGLYTFGPDLLQIKTLERLLKSTTSAGLLLLSAAHPALIGCEDLESQTAPEDWRMRLPADVADTWQTLRILPEADSLGLALPRFLLRQPYGQESNPLEMFPFQELPTSGAHEAYLWGNPAIVCGQLVVEAFLADGWGMVLSGFGEVGDVPVHVFASDEGTQVKPCAEAWLSERAGEAILEQGLIPLLSVKGRDAVRVPRLQAITRGFLATSAG